MVIIIGLGNTGERYENTYHNLGFMTARKVAQRLGISLTKSGFKAVYGEGKLGQEKVLIALPTTFMNNSGECVLLLKKKFKDARIIVIVDDIDLPAGVIRYRMHGSAGTHNGLRSIVGYIGEQFERVKIGCGRDEKVDLATFVTSKIKDTALFEKATDDGCLMVIDKIENKG